METKRTYIRQGKYMNDWSFEYYMGEHVNWIREINLGKIFQEVKTLAKLNKGLFTITVAIFTY